MVEVPPVLILPIVVSQGDEVSGSRAAVERGKSLDKYSAEIAMRLRRAGISAVCDWSHKKLAMTLRVRP